ncbi:cyclic nucleotide-binding domain-containing protein [Pantanalinema sp. GBBB05]|uniref:cyclic nucleotide-binding domain-containing protein n=1 Tax=Pantanalinema sp. GBBB05 TaxID=2604139 RepID=UPI001D7D1F66|nr:cyclic nucleotide-binding domain-containing protein [Pantanalinema sp. GBBB05]
MLGVSKLPQGSERQMHLVRWLLTVGWLSMIASLFWQPLAAHFDLGNPELLLMPMPPHQCIPVQGNCLAQQPTAIALALFWTLIVPSSILILLVFGHETWRRICPLSFLSQIPRALGIQRKRKSQKSPAAATRYELVKIRKDSWLGKNHLYVQFALLTIGLVMRLLFVNSDSVALGLFLILTILSAITVGYLYEGKSWCQYFCPMAPVQMIFNGPRGLLGSEAHQGQKQTVTQSMCRTVDKEGNEKSACVGCQSPCIDIDAERTYWETFTHPGRKFIQYGYVGLLLGFFLYYFLYAGSFGYLFSGAWLREANQSSSLLAPGFYIAKQAIPIPKLLAVPLTLITAIGMSYLILIAVEQGYWNYFKRQQQKVSPQQVSHFVFSLCTFFCFNIFFFFGSRSLLSPFPLPIHLLFNGVIVLVSTLWLSRTLGRSAGLYSRESLAGSLRRQLSKLTIDFSRFLEGRSMDDLKAEEVYVLAKVLPGFNQEQGLQLYKGVLREALEQGNTDSASSLEALRQIRQELGIKDEDHFNVLTELGAAEPELLDPKKRRTRESQLRIESYRQALATMLLDLVDSGMSLQEAMQRQKKQLQVLKLEYGMTSEEEEQVLSQILEGEKSTILRKAEVLLEQLQELALRQQVLSSHTLDEQTAVFKLLRQTAVQHKQQIITKQMLGLLEVLGDIPEAIELANTIRNLAGDVLPDILQTPEGSLTWKTRLKSDILTVLEGIPVDTHHWAPKIDAFNQPAIELTSISIPDAGTVGTLLNSHQSLIHVLEELLQELDPLIQTLALYGLNLLHPEQARRQAKQILALQQGHWLVRETAQTLLDRNQEQTQQAVQTLITHITCQGKVDIQSFQQSVVRVGRSPVNDLVLTDPKVAPHHAVFYQDGEGFSVLDLGVNGGVYVGNKHLQSDRDRLQLGQVIRLGAVKETSIRVSWEKQPLRTKAPTAIIGTLDKVLLLFESRFFRSLKPEALIELGRSASVQVYARGERLCQAGEPSDSILLLIDGTAEVVVVRGQTEQIVGTVNGGETIGEMGVLTRQKRSASVVSTSDYCCVLIIQADKFDAVLRQDPELARNLLVVLSIRLQTMTSKVKAVKA